MTLREIFKKSLKVLLVNDTEAELHENYTTDLCTNEDESLCNQNCKKCKYLKTEIVDLALINLYEDNDLYYNFKASKNKNITAITSYKKMFNELEYLNTYLIGQYAKDDLNYYKKLDELRDYGNNFIGELTTLFLPTCSPDVLPLRFNRYIKNWDELKLNKHTAGVYQKNGKQNIIDIYSCVAHDIEVIKRNIRHEVIHYALDMCNLKHDDDTGIFHALCTIYDAGAYKKMSKEETRIYKDFMEIYQNIDDLIKIEALVNSEKKPIYEYYRTLAFMAGSTDNQVNFTKYASAVRELLKSAKECGVLKAG